MSNLMPSDIVDEVADVLRRAAKGDGDRANFMTAYQILDRLPLDLRTRLIEERTIGGRGSGVSYAAPSVVSNAAERLEGIVIEYFDNRGVSMNVAGQSVTPGFEVCGLYRLES